MFHIDASRRLTSAMRRPLEAVRCCSPKGLPRKEKPAIFEGDTENIGELGRCGHILVVAFMKHACRYRICPDTMGGEIGIESSE